MIPTGTFTLGLRGCGDLAVPYRRDDEFCQADPNGPPRGHQKLGVIVQCRPTATPMLKGFRNGSRRMKASMPSGTSGALAGDFHRVLSNGGMFMYPAIVNHPNPKKNRPEGKLRLMYEAAVVAFMCREAGGDAVDETGIPDSRDSTGKTSPANGSLRWFKGIGGRYCPGLEDKKIIMTRFLVAIRSR